MKNVFVLLMVLALAGGVFADAANYELGSPWGIAGNGLNPYGFDTDGPLTDTLEGTGENADLWGTWGDSADGAGSVVVADGLCTFEVTTGTYELAFAHDNALVDLPGLPEAEVDDIEVQLTVVSVSGPGYITMKVEYYDWDVFPNNDNGQDATRIDDFETEGGVYLVTEPGVHSFKCSDLTGSSPIPAGTLAVTPVITVAGGAGTIAVIDEIWIGKVGSRDPRKATSPFPKNNDIVGAGSVTTLTWTNPATKDPNDPNPITSDVFILDAGLSPLTQDPNMSEALKDPGVLQIANNTTAESAAIPVYVPILDDHYYYWAVNCTDPNTGGTSVETLGDIWMFNAGDAPATVNAGPDEFAWMSKNDPNDPANDPESYYIKVVGTYTDDGKSPIADANFVNLDWAIEDGDAGIEKVSQVWTPGPGVHTSGTVTAVYRTYGPTAAAAASKPETAIPGWWDLQLQVYDSAGGTRMAQDVAYVRVDADCTDAAAADGDDPFDTTYDAAGNRNCKNDLADFAAFALKWLDQSDKFE